LQASIGAYLGETMRRAFGATWFCDGDHDGWRLDFTYVYLTFNPIGMAREALTLGTRRMARPPRGGRRRARDPGASPRLAGEIEEDEYYAPTTRFDVVEIAVDTLRAKCRTTGTATSRSVGRLRGK